MNVFKKKIKNLIWMLLLTMPLVALPAGCKKKEPAGTDTAKSDTEETDSGAYTFRSSDDLDLAGGTSNIINFHDLGSFTSADDIMEDTVRIRGQMLTLFGEPIYSTPDLENAYEYVILAENTDQDSYTLTVYEGPSGPAIGGDASISGIEDAAEELREYIRQAEPSDYEYQGYYFDFSLKIEYRIENGEIYYSEAEMSEEEAMEAYLECFGEK